MERSFQDLRDYTSGLTQYLNQLGSTPVGRDKATQEMFRSMKLMTEYLSDTIDSVEKEFTKMSDQIHDIKKEQDRYSQRSTVLVNDVIGLTKKVNELDGLKESVDKLTDIILRNIKNFPTSGDEYVEDTEEGFKPYRAEFTIQTYLQGGEDFTLPYSFQGRVTLNGLEMSEKSGDVSIMVHPGFRTYRVFGPLHEGDIVEFSGKIKEG